jgi:hypothetical protein
MSEDIGWKITEVTGNKERTPVGYIYHTGAVGTQVGSKTEKVVTSLRFVCSTKVSNQRDNDPLIILFWNTMTGNTGQYITSKTSVSPIDHMFRWEQEDSIMMRSVNESKDFIQELKTSKSVKFSWHSKDGTLRTTIFDLRGFNSHLGEFNALCKTEL